MSDLVSIITPVYNARQWLPTLLDSVSAQSYQNWQHIFIDDCSTDGSYEYLCEYAQQETRVTVLRLNSNSGPAKARNQGLSVAQGRYVAFLDADDVWRPNKLRVQIEWMRLNNASISYHDYRHMSFDGQLVGDLVFGSDVLDWSVLHVRRGFGCLTFIFDLKGCPLPHFVDSGRQYLAEDFIAWANIFRQGFIAYRCPFDLALYRVSPASRSGNKWRAIADVWKIYRVYESINFWKALWFYVQYLKSSVFIHRKAKPQYPIGDIV